MAVRARKRMTQSERVAQSAERLLHAAIELIAEQGFERTSAAEIADRAGYSARMVAARYGSKEALLEHLMRAEYEPRMLPAAGLDHGLDRFLAWIDRAREQNRSDPKLMKAFYTLIFEAAGPVPSLRGWTQDWLVRCIEEATDCFRAAQASGELPTDLDINAEAEQFVFSSIGYGLRYVLDGDLDTSDRALARWKFRLEELVTESFARDTGRH